MKGAQKRLDNSYIDLSWTKQFTAPSNCQIRVAIQELIPDVMLEQLPV